MSTKIDQVVLALNVMLDADRATISKMFTTRHLCDPALERNENIIVRNDGTASALGVINGLLDIITDNKHRIGVEFDPEANLITRFHLVVTQKD